jgi:chaperone required for assembly of F1-ATPase
MKRFYKEVTVASAGYTIQLDGRSVKTPMRVPLTLPTEALAEAVAEEWRSQGETVEPHAMLLTKLANTAIDRVAGHKAEIVAKVVSYANDLLCYRAAAPEDLVQRQTEAWDPLLAWALERYGVRFNTGTALRHIAQPPETLAALRQAVSAYDPFQLTALHNAATILGSLVLTLALAEDCLDAETAFALSQLDESYQAEKWGEDAAATARADALAAELSTCADFFKLASY